MKHGKARQPIPLAGRLLTLAVLTLAALLILRFLVADDGYPALLSLRGELESIQMQVEVLDGDNARLREEVEQLLDDPFAIEKIAREELDFAAPEEFIYIFPSELALDGDQKPEDQRVPGTP